jgi:hypothetical protein
MEIAQVLGLWRLPRNAGVIEIARVTKRLEKNRHMFQKIAQTFASKKGQNIYNKAQFESPI